MADHPTVDDGHWEADVVLSDGGTMHVRPIRPDDGERLQTRANLAEAIDQLLAAGAGQGVTRAQVGAHDVLMALGGISLIAGTERRPDLAAKLIDLLLHGILTD